MPRDYRDLCIEDMSAHVADLEADVAAYRALACVALGHCHELTERCRALSATVARQQAFIRDHLNAPSGRVA